MLEPTETVQLLQLMGGVYKALTDTVKPSGHPPSVKTKVHKLHIAEPDDPGYRSDIYMRSVHVSPQLQRFAPLKNMVNVLEIRQSFLIRDALLRRWGKVALFKNCTFVGIEDVLGRKLSDSEYIGEITGSPDCPFHIKINSRQLSKRLKGMPGSLMVYLVSVTHDQDIFKFFLETRDGYGEFRVKPGRIKQPNGIEHEVEYCGGCLYDDSFAQTRYQFYCNLDDNEFYPLDCVIDLFELERIYRMGDLVDSGPLQPTRAGRVYSVGDLRSNKKGIVLKESGPQLTTGGPPKRLLPRLDPSRMRIDIRDIPALPEKSEESVADQ